MRQLVRDTLSVHGRELVVESPAEALELFRRFYPHSWRGAARGPADVSLEAEGDRWHLRCGERTTGPLTGALQAAFALEHEVESALLARRGDQIALHAGGVVAGGQAHLLAGPPDVGKTTATFLLLELGHRFLCEEVALVDPANLTVAPHLRTLALDPSYLDGYSRSRTIRRGRVERFGAELARYAPARVHHAPAPLATLFLPRYRPRAEPAIEELDAAAVLPELLGYCFAPAVAAELFFDRVLRVLDGCRIVRVTCDGTAGALRLWRRLLPRAARP